MFFPRTDVHLHCVLLLPNFSLPFLCFFFTEKDRAKTRPIWNYFTEFTLIDYCCELCSLTTSLSSYQSKPSYVVLKILILFVLCVTLKAFSLDNYFLMLFVFACNKLVEFCSQGFVKQDIYLFFN